MAFGDRVACVSQPGFGGMPRVCYCDLENVVLDLFNTDLILRSHWSELVTWFAVLGGTMLRCTTGEAANPVPTAAWGREGW